MNALLYGDPSPSLRWRAAIELGGAGENDDDVAAWRAEADGSAEIASLLSSIDAARDHPRAMSFLLCRLAYLGYRGDALAAGAEAILAQQLPDGSWPLGRGDDEARPRARRRPGAAPAELPPGESYRMVTNVVALPLRGVAAAGFATDPRAERAYDWLISQALFDGSWTGSHKADHGLDGRSSGEDPDYRKLNPGEGCRSATTAVAACFALHPQRNRSLAARIAVDHLLNQNIFHAASLGWEVSRLVGLERAGGLATFYVPIDPAFLLDLASRCGLSPDHRRVRDLVAYLESRRGPYGLWEHPVHPQLSRWLTFDIENSLGRLAGGDWTGRDEPATRTPSERPRRRY